MLLTQEEITTILIHERDASPSREEAEVVAAFTENTEWAAFNASGIQYLSERLLSGGFAVAIASSSMSAALLGYKIGLAEAEKRATGEPNKNLKRETVTK